MAATAFLRDRTARASTNQATFRDLSRKLAHYDWAWGRETRVRAWVCECSHSACGQRVEMTADEYRDAHSDGGRFFVVCPSGAHSEPGVERVIRRNDRYWIIEETIEGDDQPRGSRSSASSPPIPVFSAIT